MKGFLLGFILLLSNNIIAANFQNYRGEIESIICGEVDPIHIGDACILFTDSKVSDNKIAIVMDLDEFFAVYTQSKIGNLTSLIGKEIIIDNTVLNLYKNTEKIRTLKEIDSRYFYVELEFVPYMYIAGLEAHTEIYGEEYKAAIYNYSSGKLVNIFEEADGWGPQNLCFKGEKSEVQRMLREKRTFFESLVAPEDFKLVSYRVRENKITFQLLDTFTWSLDGKLESNKSQYIDSYNIYRCRY